jgi:hypothetical protein
MVEKKCFIFRKNIYSTLLCVVLTAFAISSCEKEKAPEVDTNTLPSANFFCQIQYKTHTDGITYAFVTATNNSAYSNRWKWKRPGSRWEISGDTEFMTTKDTAVTQVYLATGEIQRFDITLIAYSDVVVNKDSTITFESHPFVQTVSVKKP